MSEEDTVESPLPQELNASENKIIPNLCSWARFHGMCGERCDLWKTYGDRVSDSENECMNICLKSVSKVTDLLYKTRD